MLRDKDDIELGNVLKANQPMVGRDEWFVRKVLNRLPKRCCPIGWLQPMVFAVSFVICAFSWIYIIFIQNYDVIVVKDLLSFAVIFVATVVLLWQFMQSLFQSE